MPRKTKETERIKDITDNILKKLNLDLNLIVTSMTPSAIKKNSGTYFRIYRSNRQLDDKQTFIIDYNPENTMILSTAKIKRHVFHEILHALTWPYIDEHSTVINYVKNRELREELDKRAAEIRENVTYVLERKLGPHIFDDWVTDEDD